MLFVQYSDLTFTSHNRRYPMKLLLILFDGFRWDYVKDMEGFNEMKRIGVHADYLIPVFPSMSFPNYYSLVTGKHDTLYIPKSHMYQ